MQRYINTLEDQGYIQVNPKTCEEYMTKHPNIPIIFDSKIIFNDEVDINIHFFSIIIYELYSFLRNRQKY
jgi:hypothetical protein